MRRAAVVWALGVTLVVAKLAPSEGASPIQVDAKPNGSPVGSTAIEFLPKLVDRSGAIASVGLVNHSTADAAFSGAALLCAAQGVPSASSEDSWLFAVPLWTGSDANTLRPGANVVTLSVQGYTIQHGLSKEGVKNFDYVFTMLKNRTVDLSGKFGDSENSRNFRQKSADLARTLSLATEYDIVSKEQYLASFDSFLDCGIRIKVLTSQGVLERSYIKLGAIDLVYWLSNYIRPENVQEAAEVGLALTGK